MRATLERYLDVFAELWTPRPRYEVWWAYEKALEDFSDSEIEAASRRIVRTFDHFPSPAEIREQAARSDFAVTTNHSDCALCGGCGWKLTEDNDGCPVAVLCDCRQKSKGAHS